MFRNIQNIIYNYLNIAIRSKTLISGVTACNSKHRKSLDLRPILWCQINVFWIRRLSTLKLKWTQLFLNLDFHRKLSLCLLQSAKKVENDLVLSCPLLTAYLCSCTCEWINMRPNQTLPHVDHPTEKPKIHGHHVEHIQKTVGSSWTRDPVGQADMKTNSLGSLLLNSFSSTDMRGNILSP